MLSKVNNNLFGTLLTLLILVIYKSWTQNERDEGVKFLNDRIMSAEDTQYQCLFLDSSQLSPLCSDCLHPGLGILQTSDHSDPHHHRQEPPPAGDTPSRCWWTWTTSWGQCPCSPTSWLEMTRSTVSDDHNKYNRSRHR